MILLVVGSSLLVGGIVFLVTSRAGAPWMPTGSAAYGRALALLELGQQDVLLDFGAGDGRVLIAAAQKYGVRGIGYEVNPILVIVGRIRSALAGVGNHVTMRGGNIFDGNFETTSAIFIFLMPETNGRIVREIIPKLAQGTRIVTYAFPLPGMIHIKKEETHHRIPLYLYAV